MNKLNFISTLALGILGGYLGSLLFQGTHPQSSRNIAAANNGETLRATQFELVDRTGKMRAELALGDGGSPGLFFFDSKGRNRLVLGIYPPSESEYPLVVLNDSHGNAAEILRLFGNNESPVLVQKNKGEDRAVMGLNPENLNPFLVYFNHGKKSIYGEF